MTIQQSVQGEVVVLSVTPGGAGEGRILRHQVGTALRAGGRDVVVDLAALRGLDAAGLGDLVGAHALVRSVGGRLVLAAVPGRIRYLLAATHLDTVMEMVATRHAALERLAATRAA